MIFKYITGSLISLILFTLSAMPAFAHRVNIFAYVEGDTIYTESYFSKKRKVHKGRLEIFSTKTGKEILKATTDEKGDFNFPIPEIIKKDRSGLLINLYASEGHRAVWTLNADEIFPDTTETKSPTPATNISPEKKISSTAPIKTTSTEIEELTRQVKKLIDKVDTLKRLIINQQEKGPGVNEIFSGIGYILGLFGITAFFLSRKK